MIAQDLLGQTVGSYRLERVLGTGGMGVVYLGVQPQIGSRVAVKVFSLEGAADPTLVERFLLEARAVNTIHHENIINVLDLGTLAAGRPYLVMEFLDGETLADRLAARGALPLAELAGLLGETLDGLAAAHAQRIVHRDLKPENIWVTRGGHVKLLDFGLAKLLGNPFAPAMTRTGATLGTPFYMSPEQVTGAPVDERTDLYAVGVILYQAATGRRPFEAASLFELLELHVKAQPLSPRELRPELPAALEAVILCAIEKARERRFASAAEMAAALRAACGLGSALASPLGATVASTPPAPAGATSLATAATVTPSPAPLAVGPSLTPRPLPPAGAAPQAATTTITTGIGRRELYIVTLVAAAVATIAVVLLLGVGRGKREEPAQPRAAGSGGGEPRASTAPPASGVRKIETGGDRRALPFPQGFDPRRFDALGFLPRALTLARALEPDAMLIDFDVDGVYPDGHIDLTASADFEASYYFRSPRLSRRPPGVPVNVDLEQRCLLYVVVTAKQLEVYRTGSFKGCSERARAAWRCSLAEVWARARKKDPKAPPGQNVVAKVSWLWDGWFLNYGEIDGRDQGSTSVPDDCR